MLLENISMAFSAIRANKMRSFLTMLGMIIGIGSVISIVSIGDSMRALVADQYKDVGVNRAILRVSYYVDEFRESDYFTLDQLERVKELFSEEIAYIVPSAGTSAEGIYGRNRMQLYFQGVDYNYNEVQNIEIIEGRMLNEADILGRKLNVVLEEKAAKKLFGSTKIIGKSFRSTIYNETKDYYVVGVYREHVTAMMALMQSFGEDQTGSLILPYSVLIGPSDYIMSLDLFARDGKLEQLKRKIVPYLAKEKNRLESEIDFYTAAEEMSSMDGIMSGLSLAVGAIAGICNRTYKRNWNPKSPWRKNQGCYDTVFNRVCTYFGIWRIFRRSHRGRVSYSWRRVNRDTSRCKTRDYWGSSRIFCISWNFLWAISSVTGSKSRSHRCVAL